MGKDADITYDEMEKAAGHLTKSKTKLDETLDHLEKYIEGLVKDGYTTRKGSQAFEDSFKEFTKGAKDTIDGLTGMSKFLTNAAKAYGDLDEQLAKGTKG
ncbi:WXG100 family type VII secretion target [Streptomyces sp. NBC_00963]|uniref:WXG100 family type VII secretion target n=1 Tax=unclassified Streptomyces TaxID=2593676 RepID=UPI002E0DCB19|nr:WXG100 family type VII secretion target [Streptomyces sp. NBC_01197]WSX43952.1 WXG100 family type VII secretion target [Streptomyces sp. NBC_00963]